MKAIVLASALLTVAASGGWAAPGDPRVLEGTLEWPSTLSREPFAVIRADDGQAYYADVSTARRRTADTLVSGDRVSVAGVEGTRPHEIAVTALSRGNAVSPSRPRTPGPAVSRATTPSEPPAPEPWRLHGRIVAIAPRTVTLKVDDGTEHTVDISALTAATHASLRRGDEILLYGEPRKTGPLIANGYLQVEPPPPAASPATAPTPR